MRCPTVAKLQAVFRDLSVDDAKLVRAFAHAVDDEAWLRTLVERVPRTAAYVRSLHSSPYGSAMWRRTVALHAMDVLCETGGVEALGPAEDRAPYRPPYEYLNAGDTYDATLIYSREGDRLFIGCWGDIAEKHEDW